MLNGVFQSSFFRSVSVLALASAAGQALLFLVLPVITRLYSPTDFGVTAIFSGILAIVLMISGFRLELAVVLPKSEQSARQLVRLVMVLNLFVAALVAVLVNVLPAQIAQFAGSSQLTDVLWLLPLAVCGAGAYRVLSFWAVRNGDFETIAKTKFAQPLANAVSQLLLGLLGFGAVGLIIGQIAGLATGLFRLSKGVSLFSLPTSFELRRYVALARRYSRFPKFDVPAALIDTLSVQLPNLLFAGLFGLTAAGWYLLAERVILGPLSLFGQALGQVIYSKSGQKKDIEFLAPQAIRIIKVLFIIICLPTILFVLFGKIGFEFLFGDEWSKSGLIASILFPAFSLQFIYSSVSLMLSATEGQKVNLKVNFILLLLKLSAIYIGFYLDGFMGSIFYFALATSLGNLIAIQLLVSHLRKYDRLGSRTSF